MIVATAPASSANLGPGFDALAMALAIDATVGTVDDESLPDRAVVVDEHHPAAVAFARGGGVGDIWMRSSIPMARGLGFSGAVRAAALVAGLAQGRPEATIAELRDDALAPGAELEGHADNVAASLFGGVVATAGGRVVRVPLGVTPAVVAWVPSTTTSTERSRRELAGDVRFEDAVFNVGRTALLVAALATGDVDALRAATEDRLHQATRLAAVDGSQLALRSGLEAGAWCGWLSGSGPTVVFLSAPDVAPWLLAELPADGTASVLAIDEVGVRLDAQ